MRLAIRLSGMALLFSAIAMSGCASSSQPEIYSVSKGGGLMTLIMAPQNEIGMLCQGAGVEAPGTQKIACVIPRTDEVGVTVVRGYPPDVSAASARRTAEIEAHEGCHVVHQVIVRTRRGLSRWLPDPPPEDLRALIAKFTRDPCHDEDFGRLNR